MSAPAGPSEQVRVSPVQHVLRAFQGRKLSMSARLLAFVLAAKLRRTMDGTWVVWRGRKSLAHISRLSTKTVSTARQELLDAGIFRARSGVGAIVADNGKCYPVAKGVRVLELVWDVEAFVQSRDRARAAIDKAIEAETHQDRLNPQKRFLAGEITNEERLQQEEAIREQARIARRRRRVIASP